MPTSSEIDAAAARWVARRDAGLSPIERRELERWLEADPRHRRAFEFYGSAWTVLGRPSQSGSGEQLEKQLAKLASKRGRRRLAGVGAALALMVGLGVATPSLIRRGPDPVVSQASVLTPAQQTLPDGSVVELRGSAQIVLEYSGSLRRVLLQSGEAHFAVRKDPTRPFVVAAGGVEVRAVGTAFSVSLGASAVEVLVTDGRVAVDKPAELGPADEPTVGDPLVTLDAGKRVEIERVPTAALPAVREVLPAELRERLAWRSPRLEFTRTPLSEAIALLNAHAPASAARFEIADAGVATMRVSGVFRADNTDAFVLLIEGGFGVKTERQGNTIVLRKAHEVLLGR